MIKRFVVIALTIFLFAFSVPAWVAAGQETQQAVYIVPVEGEITPAMAAFLESRLTVANRNNAVGVIIEISTLGGRVDSAIQMRDAIIASDVPVVVYIASRAISAGALISIASDTIIMAPGSHIGAAEPVPNEPKALAYVSGEFRSTAELTGRDPQLAMAMVDKSIEIEGLIGEGEILDMTANEALEWGYADHLANGRAEVLSVMGWANAPLVEEEPDFKFRMAQFLTRYEISSLLLSLGMLALIAELFIPGFGVAGITAIISFALYFTGGFLAGHTEWWAAIIFFAGIVLLVIEIAAPGFGVFGITGLIAIFIGIVFAAPTLSQGIGSLLIALLVAIIAVPIFFKIFGRSRLLQRFVLASEQTVAQGYTHAETKEHLLGRTGRTLTFLRPSGSISLDGQRIDALSDGEFIDKDVPIKVIRVEGTKVFVAALDDRFVQGDGI